VDALTFEVRGSIERDGPYRVTVEGAQGDGWAPLGPPTMLYDLDGPMGRHTVNRVRVPHVRGALRVTVVPLEGGLTELMTVTGESWPSGRVEPTLERVEVGDPVLVDGARARYVLRLPGARRVTGLTFEVAGDIFDREVWAGTPGPDGQPSLTSAGSIRRVSIAGTTIDMVEITGMDLRTDTLVVDVATDRGRPLAVSAVRVESPGEALLVRDAGPGPHKLYVGSVEEARTYDLGVATNELLRMSPVRGQVGALVVNPAFVPRPTREGVDAPGAELPTAGFRWRRPIVGAPGWSRVVLDRATLTHVSRDLTDLRVVDAQGRQVPFLSRSSGVGVVMKTGPMVREEVGQYSRIRVPLDESDVPVDSVTLATGNDVFERQVSIKVDRGSATQTVRSVDWTGAGDGRALVLAVGQPLGRELLLEIDNGDNPPLPVTSVTVTTPTSELALRIPEGGASLVYGRRGERSPRYDLTQLAAEAQGLRLNDAELGPESELAGPELSFFDQLVVVAAVGLLALGLVAMTVRVLRAVPVEETA